jgi:hypothetical protein
MRWIAMRPTVATLDVSAGLKLSHHQSESNVEAILPAQIAVASVPLSAFQVLLELPEADHWR